MLIGLGAFVAAAGCLDRTDECYMWGLSFERTEITRQRDGLWTIDGVLRALFSPSSSIEKPYEASYTDVEVLVLSEDRIVGRERIGTVSAEEGEDSESGCIDTHSHTIFGYC